MLERPPHYVDPRLMALDYISREKKLPAITPENYCVKIKAIAVVGVFLFESAREKEVKYILRSQCAYTFLRDENWSKVGV